MTDQLEDAGARNVEEQVERRRRAARYSGAIHSIKAEHASDRSAIELLADRLIRIAASAWFLAAHVVWFSAWILWNVGIFGVRPFDPFPFGLLTMIVSLEAIFLSIFVLMAQGRESQIAELREEITLQVLLRAEEEVTKTLQLVAGLYPRMGFQMSEDPDLPAMLGPLNARAIERELSEQINRAQGRNWVRKPPPRSR
jgi:uncharacterized membrane protein